MPDLVICNTPPLFYLHRLQNLTLLQKLYEKIVVPEAVVNELEAGRRQGEDVPAIARHEWIVTPICDNDSRRHYRKQS